MSTSHDIQGLKEELTLLKAESLLAFACACTERWVPVVELSSQEYASWLKIAIAHGWQLCLLHLLPSPTPPYFQRLEDVCRHELKENDMPFGFTPQIRQDVITAVFYMLRYANSLDVTDAAVTGMCIREAAYQVAHDFLGTRILPTHTILEPYEEELHQQRHTLDLLKSTLLTSELVEQLRTGAELSGQRIKQRIQSFGEALMRGEIDKKRTLRLWIEALDDQYAATRREAALELLNLQDSRAIEALLLTREKTTDQPLKTLITLGLGEEREQ